MAPPATGRGAVEEGRGDDGGAALRRFWRRAITCRVCPTIAPYRKFAPASRGTGRFGLVILGEAPGRVSLLNGRPFSNPRNLTIRRAFARAVAPCRLEPEEVFYFADAVKCWPRGATGANRSPRAAEVATCVGRHLGPEMEAVRPRLVLAFGARAAGAMVGHPVRLTEVHGREMRMAGGLRVIVLMHPSTANIAGMRRVGIRSLADYEAMLSRIIRKELDDLVRSGRIRLA